MTVEEKLIIELMEYCEKNGLAHLSADELLAECDQAHDNFLSDFIVRWNKAIEQTVLINYYNNEVCKKIKIYH